MKIFVLIILINLTLAQGGKITVRTPTEKKHMKYMKENITEVAVLTKEAPVEIEVSGPTWIKVNSRIPWHSDMKGEQNYTIIIQEDSLKERIMNKKTYVSKQIFGKNNSRYGESRYSLVNIPEGKHLYTFFLWSAPSDTVFLDFSFASPNIWTEIIPSSFSKALTLSGAEEKQTWYVLTPDSPLEIKISSPINIKVLTRMNFDKTLKGRQGYSIIVKENGKELRNTSFLTDKSMIYEYGKRKDLIPSKENKFFMWFPRGNHTLAFCLQGTQAKSVSLRFLKEEKSN